MAMSGRTILLRRKLTGHHGIDLNKMKSAKENH